jgi:hypothetical protein
MAMPSEAWVFGKSLAGIGGSNSSGGMGVFLLLVMCVDRYRSLRRADHSSKAFLPIVVCLCVSWSLDNEEAVVHYWLLAMGGENKL